MQGVMKISSNLDSTKRNVFDDFSFGVVVLDLENHISSINTYMKKLLNGRTTDLLSASIENILKDPIVEEVKQTHKHKEKKDYLLPDYSPVITFYHPFLDKNETLKGVIIVIELFSVFTQRLDTYTDYEIYQQILAIVKKAGSNHFRVIMDNEKSWLTTNEWNEEWAIFSGETIRKVDHISKQTIRYRREIKEKFLIERNQSLTPMELVSKPLLIKGKLIGSIQFLYLKIKEYYQEEIKQLKRLVRNLEKTKRLEDLIGKGTEINLAFEQAKLLKDMNVPLLINGERGTGKTTLARAIHMESNRRNKPFVTIDTHSLQGIKNLETVMSDIQKKARNGTIFVRMRASIPAYIQTYLLQLINKCHTTRFIFGITSPFEEIELEGQLKRLLQRYQIMLPPLRDRLEDILLIAEGLLYYLNHKYHTNISKIEDKVIEHWQQQYWPSNITQLENEMERVIANLNTYTEVLTFNQLINETKESSILSVPSKQLSLQQAIDQFEKDYINNALRANHYNKTKTAESLNISVRSLYYKMEKYEMNRGGT